jgi:hypothetical protein
MILYLCLKIKIAIMNTNINNLYKKSNLIKNKKNESFSSRRKEKYIQTRDILLNIY